MKRLLSALLLATTAGFAQAPATPAASSAPAPRIFPGLNEVEGVSVDRYIGHPELNPVHLSHGMLLTHAILQAGDPYTPGPQGAVLEYRKLLATATLMPEAKTPMETYPDQYFFYVKSGQGRLDDGKQMWDLKPGIAVLVPPSVPHRLTNTGEKPLDMIMLQWNAGPDAKKAIIVRDSYALPWCEENAHWNNTSHCIFGVADGLLQGERIYTVMLQPWAVSQPHNHPHGMEEVWTKISSGSIPVLFNSDLREMTENSAYLVPPNGKTDHSNINVSKNKVEWWIYFARSPQTGQRPAGAGNANANRPPANPNLSRDTQAATIEGRPLTQ